jgi:DNA-binding MarR family transcriptional regulator
MTKRAPAGEALTDLVLEVFRLNGRLLSVGDRMTRPLRQTSARWQVLGALETRALTVSDIARAMGLTRQSVQRIADLLAAEGLVTYAAHPGHRRAKLVTLTPRGRTILASISRRQVEWANRLGDQLGLSRLRQAAEVLRQFRDQLEAEARLPRARDRGDG